MITIVNFIHEGTKSYIQHRLTQAGGREFLFDGKAIALIAYYSQGVPRIINIDIAIAVIKDKTKNNHIIIPPFIINHAKEIDDNEVTALL